VRINQIRTFFCRLTIYNSRFAFFDF
jgi:hypothetical protein